MGKLLTLLFIFLLLLGSLGGYLFLTNKITIGSLKIASGEKQLQEGEHMLTSGKAKLAKGERQLSQGKQVYGGVKAASLMGIATILPISVVAVAVVNSDKVTSSKIAEGDRQVARGKEKVKAGEAQLEAGKLELRQGVERLHQANKIRIACGIATIFFTALFVVLGLFWGWPLIRHKAE